MRDKTSMENSGLPEDSARASLPEIGCQLIELAYSRGTRGTGLTSIRKDIRDA